MTPPKSGEEEQQRARRPGTRAAPCCASSRAESPAVIARKIGTTPIGSTTKKTAGERDEEQGQLLGHAPAHTVSRSFHTMVSASRKIFRLIFDCPTRRSSKTMGISFTRKPFFSVR